MRFPSKPQLCQCQCQSDLSCQSCQCVPWSVTWQQFNIDHPDIIDQPDTFGHQESRQVTRTSPLRSLLYVSEDLPVPVECSLSVQWCRHYKQSEPSSCSVLGNRIISVSLVLVVADMSMLSYSGTGVGHLDTCTLDVGLAHLEMLV